MCNVDVSFLTVQRWEEILEGAARLKPYVHRP
jgi:hypothetical protein